jgi:RNA polymerase sigma-70 factor, ECF subfamily
VTPREHPARERINASVLGEAEDEALLARLRESDGAALEVIFRRTSPDLIACARAHLGSADAAADVVQEVFVALWQARERLVIRESFRHYLMRAVRNRMFNATRNDRARERAVARAGREPQGETATTLDRVVEAEYVAAVAAAVADLPPRPREIFALSRQRGLTYAQISQLLGLSRKTVETHMARALRDVRSRLRHLVR